MYTVNSFYNACALLTVQTIVITTSCPSVCPSATFRGFVQANEDMIVRSSASGRTVILVSEEVKIIWIFVGDHTQRGH